MSDAVTVQAGYTTTDHRWIPLSDGCRLAAKIWLPDIAARERVPAVLEYIPYRKNDLTAARDETLHGYFAAHGYASVRVDIRGSGDSDGFLEDEYLAQEQADAVEVIGWLAQQPWCTGRVGMIGISWGGFAALQVAALAPPELKAIISVASTDDRYALDVHYMGGCLNAWDQLSWATTVDALAALPPDPSVRGREWRQCWLDRLEHAHPVIDHWLSHQRRDDYWRHGSVAEDPQAIRCAVYMVGGWADAYHDAILRFLARFQGPCKGLIGPWAHCYPHAGVPGPAIGFLQEAARWWDHWLKEKATGILDEPRLQVFMQEHAGPGAGYRDRPGRWIALSRWPSSSVAPHTYWLGDCCLDEETPASHTVKVRSPQSPAADRGAWCPGGFQLGAADFPPDQTAEDAQAASFTSPPLREEMPLLGFPTLTVQIAADRPRALMAARLCDVAPDGSSTLITRGVLNLCHRDGSDAPTVVTPGEFYEISLQLGSTGYVVPAGHRLRIAVSSTYWPWVWPSPEPVTLTIKTGIGTRLELPVLRPGPGVVTSVAFADHENGPSLATEPEGARDPGGRDLRRIAEDGVVEITDRLARGRERLVGRGVSYGAGGATTFRIREDAPLAAQIDCTRFFEIAGDGWSTKTQMTSTMSSTAEHFHLTSLLEAFDEDHRIFAKAWSGVIDRDCI